jgi:hypothetical protein
MHRQQRQHQRQHSPWASGCFLRCGCRFHAPEFRGPDMPFEAEVPVPEDAPVYDRLAGWFGRDPGWAPGVS